MPSFQQLCESMKNAPPKPAEDDNKKIAAIKAGLNQHDKNQEGKTFWDEFMAVCGDADNLAHLLGISKFVIAGWRQKIAKYLKIVQEQTAGEEAKKKNRHNMITTGDGSKDNGAANQAMGQASNGVAPAQAASQGDMAGPNPFMGS